MKYKKTAFSIVLASLLVVACIHVSGTNRKIDPNSPTFGKLNGMPMAVPVKYQFFPIEYEGDDIWNAEWLRKNRNRVPTPDMKIRTFSLLLHLPDYAPFNSENGDSWHHQKNRYGFNQDWITVGIMWNNNRGKIHEKGWFKHYIDDVRESNVKFSSAASHYEIAQNIYGLHHEVMVGASSNDRQFSWQSMHKDFYADIQDQSAKIECEQMVVPPYVPTTCEQTFIIPELDSFVDIKYNPQHLKDWRQIQKQVTSMVKTFASSGIY
ncbi:hypothetical protein [Paraburkholderia fynbosensis]|uniref:Uncharacterized protein n=1 Tax=Paraburkholderia fynbosensis TaxID=1200993 RepID=A0A6J5GFC6_9BURK|nr:hypothetical protein [Paraburkholderia fynbosensis]CAB3799661.1 hypothetical protein LMG27177_04687 [Paraburkholderia fynbosensis]